MKSCTLLFLFMFAFSLVSAQQESLKVEGNGLTRTSIHSLSGSPSDAVMQFLRGDAFSGTDWEVGNFGGTFKLLSGNDNFQTAGEEQLNVFSNGRFNILGGTEADPDNEGGKLILGNVKGLNLALDENEILARNGNAGNDLYIQAGVTSNTVLNSSGGYVFVGLPGTESSRFNVTDAEFQLRLINETLQSSDWHIGASHAGWSVGGDKLVFSPTDASADALLMLDDINDEIDAVNHKIVNLQDPTNDGDAVNLKSLNASVTEAFDDHSFVIAKMISNEAPTSLTFAGCCKYCHDLVEEGYNDWGIPNANQGAQFVGSVTGDGWTTDFTYGTIKDDSGDPTGVFFQRLLISYSSGIYSSSVQNNDTESVRSCRCVR